MKPSTRRTSIGTAAPFVLLCVGLLLFETRDLYRAQASPLELSNVHKVVGVLAALFLSTTYLVMRGVPRVLGLHGGYLGLLVAVSAVSLVFSPDPSVIALWKLVELLALLMVSLYMARLVAGGFVEPEYFYELTIRFLQCLLLVTLIGAILYPASALRPVMSEASVLARGPALLPLQLNGTIIKINPNALGSMAAILLYIYLRRLETIGLSLGGVFWAGLAGGVLVFSQSRTALVGFGLAYLGTLFLTPNKRLGGYSSFPSRLVWSLSMRSSRFGASLVAEWIRTGSPT